MEKKTANDVGDFYRAYLEYMLIYMFKYDECVVC